MRIIAKLLLLSLEEDEEVVLNAVMSALGSFENKTQLKEEIACEKLAFAGMKIDASKRLVYRSNKRAYLIIRVSSNLFMEFPKAISMQEVLKSGFRHIL